MYWQKKRRKGEEGEKNKEGEENEKDTLRQGSFNPSVKIFNAKGRTEGQVGIGLRIRKLQAIQYVKKEKKKKKSGTSEHLPIDTSANPTCTCSQHF